MKRTLATVYRPHTFSDVVEQNATVTLLQNQIETGTFKNVLLFTGSAGTGKTTSARIFAKAINGGKGTPIEIDGASNNGVENVRDIISKAQQKALDAKYKVFIIDECHALSNSAWQAMLKIIEEPPVNTVFIFCTTDPQKIPATILSRVQRYDFQRISFSGIVNRLKFIIEQEKKNGEKIDIDDASIEYIAKLADGGMRDSITMLDKVLSLDDKITLEKTTKILGGINYDIMFKLLNDIIDYKEQDVIETIEKLYSEGADLKLFIKQFTLFVLDVCKYYLFGNFDYIQIPSLFEEQLNSLKNGVPQDFVNFVLEKVNDLNSVIKWEQNVKPIVEIALKMLCKN